MYSKVTTSSHLDTTKQVNQFLPSRTSKEIEHMREKLNSQRIELIFGSYGIDIVLQENNIRVSNLHSNNVMRTFAVVNYSLPVPNWFRDTHDKIYQGSSIGQTIKNDGFNLIKEDIYLGLTKLPEFAKDRMQTDEKTAAIYVYQLIVQNQENSESIAYCTITEIYSPLYLTLGDLQLLSLEGTKKCQVITELVSKYLDDLSVIEGQLTPSYLGVKAFKDGDYKKGKELFLCAIEQEVETIESYFYLGKCLFFCDEKLAAISPLKTYIEKIKRLCELKQNNADDVANLSYAFDLLGQCYEAEKKDTAALTCYQSATKIYTYCASGWHNMGLLYIKFAQAYLEKDLKSSALLFKQAQGYIHNAIRICADNPMFLHSVASWYESYIKVLEKVIEDEGAVQQNITNNFKHAIQYYNKALDACKENHTVLKSTILDNYVECLVSFGCHLNKLGLSIEAYDTQEITTAWLNIACIYRLEKKWDKAQEALNQAKQFVPEGFIISDEERKLNESKSAAILVSTPQILFGNPNSAFQGIENEPTHDIGFQFQK